MSEEEEVEPVTAVLFPWFTEVIGVIVFFLLTRYANALPYTAVMFLLGMFMGIGHARLNKDDHLTTSIGMWSNINSEVLLLVFLPGMVFSDAYGLNVHLFQVTMWQVLNFAFPMVLAGTCLTALVAFYIFPYDWSWNFAMTFGSILSATDPVAVSSLLNEVGAPPRLKMHISGESLFNDGSSIVFYTIFSSMYLYEISPELGEEVTVGQGFALFFREAGGGAAIGIASGLGLIFVLYMLDRRLNKEENVVQVAATISFAYLTYYVADPVCGTSGVIAVVMLGITTKALGSSMINDTNLMENFWSLVEHLLNTLLFALGGVVWGEVIANTDPRKGMFEGKDWGYLIMLYVFLTIIRFFLLFANYPITSRLGLGTCWQEAVFSGWGGLRGAVGISLAISLDNEVWSNTTEEKYLDQTTKLFGMVGGTAFLTLVINATTAGPILRKLGLADSTELRKKVVKRYEHKLKDHLLDEFVHLLSDPRFRSVDFAVVRDHVSFLKEMTMEEFKSAVKRNKDKVPPEHYKEPYLANVMIYLQKDVEESGNLECGKVDLESEDLIKTIFLGYEKKDVFTISDVEAIETGKKYETSSDDFPTLCLEIRKVFIEMLRFHYEEQIAKGEIDTREGFVDFVAVESLEFASEAVSRGEPLEDWDMTQIVSETWVSSGDRLIGKVRKKVSFGLCDRCMGEVSKAVTSDYEQLRFDVQLAMAFIHSHHKSQKRLQEEFSGTSDEFARAFNLVQEESQTEVLKARQMLESKDADDVEVVVSHLLCIVLLNKGARYIEEFCSSRLLSEKEAGEYIEEIEKQLEKLHHCTMSIHPGEMSREDKAHFYKTLKESFQHSEHGGATSPAAGEGPVDTVEQPTPPADEGPEDGGE